MLDVYRVDIMVYNIYGNNKPYPITVCTHIELDVLELDLLNTLCVWVSTVLIYLTSVDQIDFCFKISCIVFLFYIFCLNIFYLFSYIFQNVHRSVTVIDWNYNAINH